MSEDMEPSPGCGDRQSRAAGFNALTGSPADQYSHVIRCNLSQKSTPVQCACASASSLRYVTGVYHETLSLHYMSRKSHM